jgi:glucose-6-phosphate 1-dehydrogenase
MIRIVVFGASGDLAKRKTYPALFGLFLHNYLYGDFQVIGYARSVLSRQEYYARMVPFFKKAFGEECEEKGREFFHQHCLFYHGQYDSSDEIELQLRPALGVGQQQPALRIFYLALPPTIFITVAKMIKDHLYETSTGILNRVVVEKPFGKDYESSQQLDANLKPLFDEHEIYRIDHYLGKEMVKNMVILRFANIFFEAIWSREHIASVQVIFKETLGVEGRGGYYDEYGVIRDVLQNHMLQMLSIVAMERPKSLSPDDVRDAKLEALKAMRTLTMQDIIIGQYGRSVDGTVPGYVEDETIPSGSITATYVMAVCYIDNDRWRGIPFILRTGKGLNEAKSEIRIQFHESSGGHMFNDNSNNNGSDGGHDFPRNELVMRVQPNEALYLKMVTKRPGLSSDPLVTDLDLTYKDRFEGVLIPDAYETLLLAILQGEQQNFVRSDELAEAWRIVTPVLHQIEAEHVRPIMYPGGSRGPKEADEWMERLGYKRSEMDYWPWRRGNKMSGRASPTSI